MNLPTVAAFLGAGWLRSTLCPRAFVCVHAIPRAPPTRASFQSPSVPPATCLIDSALPLTITILAALVLVVSHYRTEGAATDAGYTPLPTAAPCVEGDDPVRAATLALDEEVKHSLYPEADHDPDALQDTLRDADVSPRFYVKKWLKAFLMFKIALTYFSLLRNRLNDALSLPTLATVRPSVQLVLWSALFAAYLYTNIYRRRRNQTERHQWFYHTIIYTMLVVVTVDVYSEFNSDPSFDWTWQTLFHPYARTMLVALLVFHIDLAAIALFTERGPTHLTVPEIHHGTTEPVEVRLSPEYTASLGSNWTFGWLNDILSAGYSRTLNFADLWHLPEADLAYPSWVKFRADQRPGRSLFANLLVNQRYLIISQLTVSSVRHVTRFGGIYFMNQLLAYMESPAGRPRSTAYLFVVALLVNQVFTTVCANKALFWGRHMSFQINGILAGEISRKTLLRRQTTRTDQPAPPTTGDDAATSDDDDDNQDFSANGKVMNLVSSDMKRVAEAASYAVDVVCIPIELTVGIFYLWQLLGLSALVAVGVLVLSYAPNKYFFKRATVLEDDSNTISDRRMAAITELLNGVRIVKLFGWENNFQSKIQAIRDEQLTVIRKYQRMWTIIIGSYFFIPLAVIVSSFATYTMTGHVLTASVAFTSLAVCQIIQDAFFSFINYVQYLIGSRVSLNRLDRYLGEPEVEPTATWTVPAPPTDWKAAVGGDGDDAAARSTLGFVNASFSWAPSGPAPTVAPIAMPLASAKADRTPAVASDASTAGNTASSPSTASSASLSPAAAPQFIAPTEGDSISPCDIATEAPTAPFALTDLNLAFPTGRLTLVAGPTGSGKTSLLSALLGEMPRTAGQVLVPTTHGHLSDVAYVPQEAWLRNATVRENILFGHPFDAARYQEVVDACALTPDLAILKAGDRTEIGEKGVTLSGGQKQRVALARAVYSPCRHLLFDDCLSAVDAHTAQYIVDHCLCGPVLRGRTCILVTHHVRLCLPAASYMVVLDRSLGVVGAGPPDDLVHANTVSTVLLAAELEGLKQHDGQAGGIIDTPKTSGEHPPTAVAASPTADDGADSGTLVDDEYAAEGTVKWSVYKAYMAAAGSRNFWVLMTGILVLSQVVVICQDYWVRIWVASANGHAQLIAGDAAELTGSPGRLRTSLLITGVLDDTAVGAFSLRGGDSDNGGGPDDRALNAGFFLGVYVGLGLLASVLQLIRYFFTYVQGSYSASRIIHDRLLSHIMRATPHFFDSTPVGRIINRFSGDMRTIDETAMNAVSMFLGDLVTCSGVLVVVSLVTPPFVLVALSVAALNLYTGHFFLRSLRELKRIESIRLAPVLSLFSELINGITTIRAFGVQARYVADTLRKTDDFNRPFYLIWATNRWLQLRTDLYGSLVSFAAGLLIVARLEHLDAGLAGFSLSTSLAFSVHVYWLIRGYGEMEMAMNSMERIQQYCEVEQEAPAVIADRRVDPTWPAHGAIEIQDLVIAYRPDSDPVIRQVSASIHPGEKIGLVGRTGAGKSTLGLAFLRFIEPTAGTITIDGVDITQLGLDDLRHRVTVIPQDPTLFKGTVRDNLDPFGEYDDHRLWEALRSTHLAPRVAAPTAPVTSVGSTTDLLSQSSMTLKPSQLSLNSTTASAHPGLLSVASAAHKTPGTVDEEASSVHGGSTTSNPRAVRAVFDSLEAPIAEGGRNLSLGQRQLVALARALVRQSRVIIMDEATASVDFETDHHIQQTIREEFAPATLLCIAHRLRTVIDYDRIMVLDQGRLVEFDSPLALLERSESVFHSMCVKSGDFDVLLALARHKRQSTETPLITLAA
ncbi:hypothetical protein IWQ60_004913 [Tieghemiomyces parasiticus]|uniref:P-loop containing nucleoside triphosphate hydrolase protein n=1 Tax=Tieghemiomyces parasiticus TaxID=78921 RepID=A0A9W8DTH6_9FUNG|nr:hypothetical protein IWQ60_004913 [Tieghemiomyces parasiticus]